MTISATSVATAVFSVLATHPTLVNSAFKVLLGERINSDPEETPWLCVWPGDVNEKPGYVGGPPGIWRGTCAVDIYHQQYNVDCGGALLRQLKQVEDLVRAAVASDVTLGGVTLGIVSMQSRLFDYQLKEEAQFITNMVRVLFDVTG